MPGKGLQHIPFRIPDKWDAKWYEQHLREVLALADTRNAIEGSGIIITGQSGEQATISTSEDLQNLLLQTFVLATPSGFLEFERVLAGEPGVIEIDDGGAGGNITVSIEDHGINLGKLIELSGAGILGNPVDAVGEIQNINPEQALSVLHFDGSGIVFDLIDHTYVSDFDEAAADAVGAILTDTASIDLVYNDGSNTISANIIDEYVQDLMATTLVDSASIDFTYSDVGGTITAAVLPAGVDHNALANLTTGDPHTQYPLAASAETIGGAWDFSVGLDVPADSQEIRIGAGNDLRLYHDGTDSIIRTDTGSLRMGNGLITMSRDFVTFPAAILTSDASLVAGKNTAGSAFNIASFAGGNCGIRFYNAMGGTGALSAVTTAGISYLMFMGAAGYDGSAFTGSAGLIGIRPGSDWTGSNYETFITFETTANGSTARTVRCRVPSDGGFAVQDGITTPATLAGFAIIYVDTADGDLKVKFGDGTVKTIVTD